MMYLTLFNSIMVCRSLSSYLSIMFAERSHFQRLLPISIEALYADWTLLFEWKNYFTDPFFDSVHFVSFIDMFILSPHYSSCISFRYGIARVIFGCHESITDIYNYFIHSGIRESNFNENDKVCRYYNYRRMDDA